jgi:hypothetical protein
MQDDYTLLLWLPWPVILKPETTKSLLLEYESVTQKVLIPLQAVLLNAKQL